MENKLQLNYNNKYINNNNNNNQKEINQENYPQYENIYYYKQKQNNKNNIESPKVIPNKIIPTNNALYSTYQQNKKIIKNINQNNITIKNKNLNPEKISYQIAQNNDIENNNSFLNQNEDIQYENNYQINQNQLKQDLKPVQNFQISNYQLNLQQQPFEDLSFISQKPFQLYENNNNNNNNNKHSNIVNIDNQSSAIQLSFISKKPKKKCKTSTIFQIGLNQTPIGFSFIAEKPNKYTNNNNNNNNLNESNGQNLSFISNKQIDSNEFSLKHKNNLKIMPNYQNKNGKNKNENQSKPKPILQIVSKNNNYNKKLQENLLPQQNINGFSINSKNKDNNFLFTSKSANELFNISNNQDLSFISNSKETENLLEINGININDYREYKINRSILGNISPSKEKQIFSISNGLSSSQRSTNNSKYNIYNNYIMLNSQLCYLSQKPNNFEEKNYYKQYDLDCSIPKKNIKIEYFDMQPVTFKIIPVYIQEEIVKKKYEMELKKIYGKKEFKNCVGVRVCQMRFKPYKIFRAVEMKFIINNKGENKEKEEEDKKENEVNNEEEDKKEDEKEIQKNEDVLEKSFNNKGNKKRKKRRRK